MSDELAEGVFAAWAVRVEAGEDLSFDELLRSHPGIADELRRLHDDWKLFAPLLGRVVPGLIASSEHMSMPPLSSADDEGVEPPSAELLDRLGIHAPNTGRYRFRSVIGRGGGGVVLKVWDTKLNRPLAMKVVLGRGEGGRPTGDTPKVDGRTLSRFVDEARIASQLNHPGIVPVHELGADETGRAFFTMKLVRGETLATIFEHVKTGKDGWNQTRALNMILRACEAMAFAHDKGVVHRDLKPANIMVGSYGEVYVMDWGLARVLGEKDQRDIRLKPRPNQSVVDSLRTADRAGADDSPLLTIDGIPIGTPAYMSPEQAKGDIEAVGVRSDVYAIGAMIYELVAGQMPYIEPGTRIAPHTVVRWVIDGPPRPIQQLAPRAPVELIAIANKAMERDSTQRYTDMLALAHDLRAYLERRVVSAFATGAWPELRSWTRRNPMTVFAVALSIAIALLGLIGTRSAKSSRLLADRYDESRLLLSASLYDRSHSSDDTINAQHRLAARVVNGDWTQEDLRRLITNTVAFDFVCKSLSTDARLSVVCGPSTVRPLETIPKQLAYLADIAISVDGIVRESRRHGPYLIGAAHYAIGRTDTQFTFANEALGQHNVSATASVQLIRVDRAHPRTMWGSNALKTHVRNDETLPAIDFTPLGLPIDVLIGTRTTLVIGTSTTLYPLAIDVHEFEPRYAYRVKASAHEYTSPDASIPDQLQPLASLMHRSPHEYRLYEIIVLFPPIEVLTPIHLDVSCCDGVVSLEEAVFQFEPTARDVVREPSAYKRGLPISVTLGRAVVDRTSNSVLPRKSSEYVLYAAVRLNPGVDSSSLTLHIQTGPERVVAHTQNDYFGKLTCDIPIEGVVTQN